MKHIQTNWETQINILCIGQAVLMVMLAMSLPYWPLYVAKLGNFSPIEIRYWSGAIYIAPFISSIFISPIWGRFADKHGYKMMIMRACVGLVITQALIMCMTNVFWIFIIRFLQGALAGFIPAAQAWAINIGPKESRGRIIGKLQASVAFGNLFGPFIGGILASYAGYRAIFSISTLICFLMTTVFFFILKNPLLQKEEKPLNSSSPENKIQTVFKLNNTLLSFLFVIVLAQISQSMVTPIFSLFVTEELLGSTMTIGTLYAASGLMMLVSAPLLGKYLDKLKNKTREISYVLFALLMLAALLQIVHAYSRSVEVIFILRLLWGVCLGGVLPILTRILIENARENHRGLVLGFGNSANRLGTLLGISSGAILEANFGYTCSFLINAALYIIGAGLILAYIKSLYSAQESYSLER